MLEIVLMRTFFLLYASDYQVERRQYKPGKSRSSESRSFTVLSSVCRCWWLTLSGWPQSPTPHWLRHKLRNLLERECTKLTRNPFMSGLHSVDSTMSRGRECWNSTCSKRCEKRCDSNSVLSQFVELTEQNIHLYSPQMVADKKQTDRQCFSTEDEWAV